MVIFTLLIKKQKGNFHLSLMGGSLILFEFENLLKAQRVRLLKNFVFEKKNLQLEWWRPNMDFFRNRESDKNA